LSQLYGYGMRIRKRGMFGKRGLECVKAFEEGRRKSRETMVGKSSHSNEEERTAGPEVKTISRGEEILRDKKEMMMDMERIIVLN